MRLFSILCLFGFVSLAQAAEIQIPPDKEIIEFHHSKLGNVTFLHKMHADMEGMECTTCHHKFEGVGQPEGCHGCHQVKPEDDTPKAIKAFHARCRGCHQYTVEELGLKAGPVKKCTLCHIKPDRDGPAAKSGETAAAQP